MELFCINSTFLGKNKKMLYHETINVDIIVAESTTQTCNNFDIGNKSIAILLVSLLTDIIESTLSRTRAISSISYERR